MMTPFDWNAALHPDVHWKHAYAVVIREAKNYLDSNQVVGISTNELVEALYPAVKARGDAITVRKRIYNGLRAWWQNDPSSDQYQSKGTGRRSFGRTVYPPMWHARRDVPLDPGQVRCPHCGKTFTMEKTNG